ncbi:MAG: AI-2E family transporter [Chroococcales cyanobacterium]
MNYVFTPLQKFLITWLLILAAGWATLTTLGYVGELISILITAALIAFLFNYAVMILQPILPRPLAAILVYLFAALVLVVLSFTLFPPVFNQARQLITKLPELVAQGQEQLSSFQLWIAERNLPFDVNSLSSQVLTQLQTQAEAIASTGFGLVLGTFNWFLDLIIILVISFYMLLDGKRLWKGLIRFFSPKIQKELSYSLQRNLQRFVTGQLLLGLFMATSLTLAFWLLEVPFFLLFAVFIGLLEIIPFIGATLGITAVVITVLFIDWWLGVQVLAASLAVQQIKDNLVAPRIMGNLTGLSPVIIFVALLLGAKVGGFLGVILAIPLTGVLKSLADVILDPSLPPQTGDFFANPIESEQSSDVLSIKDDN